MEYLEQIRNFSLNNKLNKYEDYVNYFYKLDIDEQTEIIAMMLDYKKYNVCNIKNGNLDKLYNAYKILLHKLEYNELNNKEREIYENINAYLIIDNEFDNNLLFRKYVKKYLNNLNSYNFNRRIFLIMQDVLNILNDYYNKNIKFLLVDFVEYAAVNWLNIEYKNNILLNEEEFNNYFYSNEKTKINVIEKTIYYLYTVCHEYEHILQKENLFAYNNSNIYENDLYLMAIFNNFYDLYHNNFYIEKEANSYGVLNALEYISKYFHDKEIIKNDLRKYLSKEFNYNNMNNKEFLIIYKTYLLFIKICQNLNISNKRLTEVDKLYKSMKKTFENK